MDPVAYMQVKEMGREIDTHATTTDPSYLFPPDYLDATVKNSGRAKFNSDGNVVSDDGSAWIGGNPFPDPQNGTEAICKYPPCLGDVTTIRSTQLRKMI